jgi:hypothetical protein
MPRASTFADEPGGASIITRGGREVTGDDVLSLAMQHLDEQYVLGARVPMANPDWHGPWDCAEFASWCVYQSSGLLFGTQPSDDAVRADAYTGYWATQANAAHCTIPLADAVVIVGALILRYPMQGATGHIVISDGSGGTVEAHSSADGVIQARVDNRRWDTGVLVPGIRYFRTGEPVTPAPPPAGVIRLTTPLTRSPAVAEIQRRLVQLGYSPGRVDQVFGPQTAEAVRRFQADRGLVADGEVGPITLAALNA